MQWISHKEISQLTMFLQSHRGHRLTQPIASKLTDSALSASWVIILDGNEPRVPVSISVCLLPVYKCSIVTNWQIKCSLSLSCIQIDARNLILKGKIYGCNSICAVSEPSAWSAPEATVKQQHSLFWTPFILINKGFFLWSHTSHRAIWKWLLSQVLREKQTRAKEQWKS